MPTDRKHISARPQSHFCRALQSYLLFSCGIPAQQCANCKPTALPINYKQYFVPDGHQQGTINGQNFNFALQGHTKRKHDYSAKKARKLKHQHKYVDWLHDSGANCHIVNDISYFHDIHEWRSDFGISIAIGLTCAVNGG